MVSMKSYCNHFQCILFLSQWKSLGQFCFKFSWPICLFCFIKSVLSKCWPVTPVFIKKNSTEVKNKGCASPLSFIWYCVEPYICASVSSHSWWCFHNPLNCDTDSCCARHASQLIKIDKNTWNIKSSQFHLMQVTRNFLLQLLKACLLRWKSHTFTCVCVGGGCVRARVRARGRVCGGVRGCVCVVT